MSNCHSEVNQPETNQLYLLQYGRKKLMHGGIAGMFLSLIGVGVLFLSGKTEGIALLIFILTFITSFAIGYGPVLWVLLAEIYPTKIRGCAMSIAVLTLWVGTAIVGQVVPRMLKTLSPAGTFFVFCGMLYPGSFPIGKNSRNQGNVS